MCQGRSISGKPAVEGGDCVFGRLELGRGGPPGDGEPGDVLPHVK